jgi:hypothetical protein
MQHALPRRFPNRNALARRQVAQIAQDVVRVPNHQHFFSDLEETVQPLPPIADHGNPTCSCFEQPDAGGIAGVLHRVPRDIQRESLRSVKCRMLPR